MDFWSKLIAGVGALPVSTSKAALNNPDKRLARFKREYSKLINLWRNSPNLARDESTAEDIRDCLQDLTSLLSDESRRPSPHLCIAFAAEKQIYSSIGKIALTAYDEGIVRETVAVFSTLVDSEEEDFLESDSFARSLMSLLTRIAGANDIGLSPETEGEVVELMFGIAAKIRLQPEILPAWFTAHSDEGVSDNYANKAERFAGKTHRNDFPLFYLLIDYVHHEGRVGDFARTGLLYIIESASNDMALEQWIVESDLATLMATGLGALYSQLSRKLVVDYPEDDIPAILAMSDYERPVTTTEIVSSASLDFQSHMGTFLSYLVFWQDVLEHCKSIEVKSTLLEHFQILFLQQLLYPSLLESSDVDGGSSVAVLTYLRRILDSLDHPDMIHLILHYLLALPETAPTKSTGSRASVSAARKRKSLDLATMMALSAEERPTPALFNLVDLILGSIRSQNQQTIAVTLQLVSTILRRHHRYAVTTLLRTAVILNEEPQRTIGMHEQEMDFLLGLAGKLGGEEDLDETYDNHVKDSLTLLESHPCSIPIIAPKGASGTSKAPGVHTSIPGGPRDVHSHTLRPDDPLLKALSDALEGFFINSVETNLSLTETIVDLAACGLMHIEGWLLPDPAKVDYDDDGCVLEEVDESDDSAEATEKRQMNALRKARRTPRWTDEKLPTLLLILKKLVDQIQTYRTEIPRFDDLLAQRRAVFKDNEVESATQSSTPFMNRRQDGGSAFDSRSTSRSGSPPRLSAIDSLAQRIFPDLATPSRSSSPRGRKDNNFFSTPTQSRLRDNGGVNTPPPQFPMLDSSSRGSSRNLQPAVDNVPASQVAAFAAIDRSILQRKVGIPSSNGELLPVPFPNLRKSSEPLLEESSASSAVGESAVEEENLVSVSHVLTNILVLQEFLLELAAIVQVRAGLFGEIKFV